MPAEHAVTVAPFGTWSSPVTVDLLLDSIVILDGPRIDGDAVLWAEVRFDEQGTCSIWRQSGNGEPERLTTPNQNVHNAVYEYGGGAWDASGGVIAFCDRASGRILLRDVDGSCRPLTTPDDDARYGDLALAVDAGVLLAVRERHVGGADPLHDVVGLRLVDPGDEPVRPITLATGADFYASPRLCVDGRLAWVEWQHPDMPWQSTRLMTGTLRNDRVLEAAHVAGGPDESVLDPTWQRGVDGRWTLLFCSDRSGYWNLYRQQAPHVEPEAVAPRDADFARPPWGLGRQMYAPAGDGSVVCSWHEGGSNALGVLSADGKLHRLKTAASAVQCVAAGSRRAAAVVGFPDRPPAVIAWDVGAHHDASELPAVRVSGGTVVPEAAVSRPEAVTWEGQCGTVSGWYYPPASANCTGPNGALPPLIVVGHGGPTNMSLPVFGLDRHLWTTRGFAVLDVNYSGSSGFGRAYRERLDGQWGVVDVADFVDGACAMVEQGRADPDALVVRGASAGGYTALRALTTSSVFRAGVILYGIGDLSAMARDTHKFESHYLDTLVGDPDEHADRYQARSPLGAVEAIDCPVLLLQGLDDKVVPPEQSRTMAAALRERAVPVELLEFEGEGHGFRGRDTLVRTFEAEVSFLRRVLHGEP
jgi:dipeptidyl aminopeptidase/acylaminoacyl peptidase